MNQRFFILNVMLICMSYSSFSQAPLAALNPNAEHDMIDGFYQRSVNVKVPDSVFTILKNYAYNRGLAVSSVLKNELTLRILYNNDIPEEKRIQVCNFILRTTKDENAYIPLFLVQNIKSGLTIQNKRKD